MTIELTLLAASSVLGIARCRRSAWSHAASASERRPAPSWSAASQDRIWPERDSRVPSSSCELHNDVRCGIACASDAWDRL